MSDGDTQPPAQPLVDRDRDGLPDVAEAAIDSSARYQARVALITAIVALVSAILGPAVSLLINNSQIDSQTSQIKAQQEQFEQEITTTNQQSEAEFVRTQRSTAYADFLTAFNNGAIDLLGAAGLFRGRSGTAKQVQDQVQKSITAVKDFSSTFFKVRIVASKESNEKALALYQEFNNWSGSLLTTFGAIAGGAQISAEQEQLLASTGDEYSKLLDMADAFVTEGRADMGKDRSLDD